MIFDHITQNYRALKNEKYNGTVEITNVEITNSHPAAFGTSWLQVLGNSV